MFHPVRETGVTLYAAKLERYGEVKDIPPVSALNTQISWSSSDP